MGLEKPVRGVSVFRKLLPYLAIFLIFNICFYEYTSQLVSFEFKEILFSNAYPPIYGIVRMGFKWLPDPAPLLSLPILILDLSVVFYVLFTKNETKRLERLSVGMFIFSYFGMCTTWYGSLAPFNLLFGKTWMLYVFFAAILAGMGVDMLFSPTRPSEPEESQRRPR